jgi:hypothetical protein
MPLQVPFDSTENSLVSAALADGCIRVFVVAFFAVCALLSRLGAAAAFVGVDALCLEESNQKLSIKAHDQLHFMLPIQPPPPPPPPLSPMPLTSTAVFCSFSAVHRPNQHPPPPPEPPGPATQALRPRPAQHARANRRRRAVERVGGERHGTKLKGFCVGACPVCSYPITLASIHRLALQFAGISETHAEFGSVRGVVIFLLLAVLHAWLLLGFV